MCIRCRLSIISLEAHNCFQYRGRIDFQHMHQICSPSVCYKNYRYLSYRGDCSHHHISGHNRNQCHHCKDPLTISTAHIFHCRNGDQDCSLRNYYKTRRIFYQNKHQTNICYHLHNCCYYCMLRLGSCNRSVCLLKCTHKSSSLL
jgi:hypothetical protein